MLNAINALIVFKININMHMYSALDYLIRLVCLEKSVVWKAGELDSGSVGVQAAGKLHWLTYWTAAWNCFHTTVS
jgi:hypothetical protein